MIPLNPHTAHINTADLITLREAAALLGRDTGRRPTAMVEAFVRRGKLTAYADPAAPASVNTPRFVLRSAVLGLADARHP